MPIEPNLLNDFRSLRDVASLQPDYDAKVWEILAPPSEVSMLPPLYLYRCQYGAEATPVPR